ncbi:MAG: class I SAM-dependent methyltransferase [Chitinophagaceae bacterium]
MRKELQILNTWTLNAEAWIDTIASNGIETRRLVTDKAIEETIIYLKPAKMLDLGCGEGWLIRRIQEKLPGTEFTGIDAIPALIKAAETRTPNATFLTFSYESIIDGQYFPVETFDLIVINFALFGNEIVVDLINKIRPFISAGGQLVIQTLHPVTANGGEPYTDGWREGNWNGFSNDFRSPSPWYFRTLESWINLFKNSGFTLIKMQEPIHPNTLKPAAVIFILSA